MHACCIGYTITRDKKEEKIGPLDHCKRLQDARTCSWARKEANSSTTQDGSCKKAFGNARHHMNG